MINFDNLEVAYARLSDKEIHRVYRLFKLMSNPILNKIGTKLGLIAVKLRLPLVETIVYKTIFKQFVGGRTLMECQSLVTELYNNDILTILDVAVEGSETEEQYNRVLRETIDAIHFAKINDSTPVVTTKITGLADTELLERYTSGKCSDTDMELFKRVEKRLDTICKMAKESKVSIFIDAEESWIQKAIDDLCMTMIRRYNRDYAVVYNTYQLYRKDKLNELKKDIEEAKEESFILGAKVVRGAYMEKERDRAEDLGVPCLIQDTKSDTDADFNAAIESCLSDYEVVSLCNASHNRQSIELQLKFMAEKNIPKKHPHLNFCQLYGMSDYLTYNLAYSGYISSKYVPYGKVREVFPYLIRRAQENSSALGEMSRELEMLKTEIARRKGLKA